MAIKDEILKERENSKIESFTYSYIKDQDEETVSFIGNSGMSDLTIVIYAYSAGFGEIYKSFLTRIVNWIQKGVFNHEKFNDLRVHQLELTSSLALAHWMNTGFNEVSLWKNAVYWQEQLNLDLDHSVKMDKEDKESLALDILRYIQAKEYDKAIKLYEQSISALGKPFKFSAKLTSYNLAYAYCLHFAEGMFSVEELEKAGRVFLEKHLQALYTSGRSIEMLYWLKTICDAREKDYTPEEVIYTFYEFVKDEDKPDFVKELLNK